MGFSASTLKSAINMYTQNDNWGTTDQLDVIIQQAEERINQTVQIASYNTTVTAGNIDQNAFTATEGAIFVKVADSAVAPISPLYFKIRDGSSQTSNAWSFLLLKDYNFLQEYAPKDSSTGTPIYYSFYYKLTDSDKSVFNFAPYLSASSNSKDYEILYWLQPSSIISDVGGTWLSQHGESALLYGCLVEAYTFLKGSADMLQVYDARYKEALQALVSSQQGAFRNSSYRDRAMYGAV